VTDSDRDVLATRIADSVLGQNDSWARRMFELARALRADGGGPVYDLSLGNPSLEPPRRWAEAIVELLRDEPEGMHRYMTNSGFLEVREFVAGRERERYGLPGLEPHDVTMTVGAAGGLNVLLKSLVDPDDRVFVPAPFFPEYEHYCLNHGAQLVPVKAGPGFNLDIDAIIDAIETNREHARILLLNSPNNPTGAIYEAASLDALAARLLELDLPRPLWIIEDTPYRDLVHDTGASFAVPSMLGRWPNTVLVTSHSKDLGLAGERIGYLVISPEARGRELLHRAVTFCNRTLGFVNAPALMQRVLPKVLGQPGGRVEVRVYADNCARMAAGLRELGFELPDPQAGFFLFPRLPEHLREAGGPALTEKLLQRRTLVVPGVAFGVPGYLRLAMCVEPAAVDGALDAFRAVCA
jgi:aspartate aminotransferase